MQRIVSLDIYKALAAVMVIIIHVTASPIVTLTKGAAVDVLIVINRFANPSVPMFVFASGLSLFYIYGDRRIVFLKFIKKRLPKILIPYLAWCAIYYAYYVYKGIYAFSAQTFALNVLSGRLMYHLYFVVIIIQFYLMFGIINYVVKRFSGSVILPVGLMINILAAKVLPISYADRSFLTYLIYFLLGCYFAKNLKGASSFLCRYKVVLTLGFLSLGGIYAYQFYEAQVLNISARFIPDPYAYISFCAVSVLVYYLASMGLDQATIGIPVDGAGIVSVDGAGIVRPDGAGVGLTRRVLLAISEGSYYIYLSHPLAIIAAGSISARLAITGVIDQMFVAFILIWLTAVPLSILYANLKSHYKQRRTQRPVKTTE